MARVAMHTFVLICCLLSVYPMFVMVSGSFKDIS